MRVSQLFSASTLHRFALVAWMAGVYLCINFVLRVLLLWHTGSEALPASVAGWLQIFIVGPAYDLVTLLALAAPLGLLLWLLPERVLRSRVWRGVDFVLRFAIVFGMLFIAMSEWTFWEEFGSRFNFIAVDYLVYTHEVIGNIRESYPVGLWLSALALLALVITAATWRWPRVPAEVPPLPFRSRTRLIALWAALGALTGGLVSAEEKDLSANTYVNELSGNGVYQFFHAFRANELDYERFYPSLPRAEAFATMRRLLAEPGARFVSDDPQDLTRQIVHAGPEKHLNVVLISVESLSADFMQAFGNTQGITPNLDRLAKEGVFFTGLYANGTRTVRGLEALSLSVPPTPGQSIVKRPHNEGLFTLASVFNDKGYRSKYVYGGHGYFDNMNAYFSANGYEVVDRSALAEEDIHYENIWGVADEDLFTLTLRQMRADAAAGKPFFMHVMTTSNHRPFTYPEGRIDIPSKSGREGGVKYTDWAIGKFIDEARKEPFFADTVFVITADHCASSAGKTDLPVNRYHVPMIVYAPAQFKPASVDRLMSQIDIAPTLLGMLNFSYRSKFFGHDITKLEPGRENAFIGNYQELGYIHDGKLAILAPGRKSRVVIPDFADGSAAPGTADPELVRDAESYYEVASWLFHHGGMRAL